MPRIRLKDAQPGQTLTRPAVTHTGVVMVQQGTELTASLIERLANLGIDYVSVAAAAQQGKPLDVALRELDERFAGLEDDAWMMEFKALLARQRREGGAKPADHG